MQSRTILVLRLIPDKGRSKALPRFIAMRGISNNFLVHLPSWHDELCVCKEKQIKLLLMFQNVIHLEKTSNSESVSLPVWRLEIFCWGDMKKNLIKGRSLESAWSLLKYPWRTLGVGRKSRTLPPPIRIFFQHSVFFFVVSSHLLTIGSSSGVVVNLLAWRARCPGFDSRSRATIQRLVISCFKGRSMAEILLERC